MTEEKKVCPKCGNANYKSTLVAYLGRNENDVECACGWKGKAYQLVHAVEKKEEKFCKDCKSYDCKKCAITGNFTKRKETCDNFFRKW